MKYGLIGASGKMGLEIESVFREEGHELVFKYDIGGTEINGTPEVIIDFSLPGAFNSTIEFVEKYNAPLVIGTTGLTDDQLNKLKEISSKIPVVQSYNYSVGIQMLLRCTELLSKNLPGWDVEITETHHRFKKDKPSGTALMIKKALNKDVNISSLRVGNVPGDHAVIFGSLGEVLSLTHHATSRRTFAEGVLRSAIFIVNKNKGLFTFKDVLFGNEG